MHTDPFRTGRDPHPDSEHRAESGTFGGVAKPDISAAIADAHSEYIADRLYVTAIRPNDEPESYADGGAECDTDTLTAAIRDTAQRFAIAGDLPVAVIEQRLRDAIDTFNLTDPDDAA